jgi:hypothetical protein
MLIVYRGPADDHSRICVPQVYADVKLRISLIPDFHDSDIANHVGMSRTTNALIQQY